MPAEAPLGLATDENARGPVSSSRKWVFAVGALAVAGVGIGVVAFSSSSSTPKSDPPVAVVPPPKITPTSPAASPDLPAAELDAGPQPSGEDASVNAPGASPLVGDAVRGAPDASVVGTGQPRTAGAPAKKQTVLATRIKKLEARLRKLEKDPSQSVGIFVTQMKRLKELLGTAKTASDFDTIDVTLSRIEADLNEL